MWLAMICHVTWLLAFSVKGASESTPYNKNIQNILASLLTPYLVKLFSRNSTNEVSPNATLIGVG